VTYTEAEMPYVAQADQAVASVTDDILTKAAEFDGLDLHQAGFEFMDWLDSMPVTRIGLCAAVAILALRIHRQGQMPDGTDG
jgi:hypothetical protein